MEELCKLVEEVVARLQAERKARGGESGYDSEPGYDDELGPLLTVRHVLKSQPFHGINRKVTQWGSGIERMGLQPASPRVSPSTPPTAPLQGPPRATPP